MAHTWKIAALSVLMSAACWITGAAQAESVSLTFASVVATVRGVATAVAGAAGALTTLGDPQPAPSATSHTQEASCLRLVRVVMASTLARLAACGK